MAEVILPVGKDVEIHRVGAEPVAHPVVPAPVAQQGPVRGLVHEDRESQLAASDHRDGGEDRERVGGDGDEHHRGADEAPVDEDREPAASVPELEELPSLGDGNCVLPGHVTTPSSSPTRSMMRRSTGARASGRMSNPRMKLAQQARPTRSYRRMAATSAARSAAGTRDSGSNGSSTSCRMVRPPSRKDSTMASCGGSSARRASL